LNRRSIGEGISRSYVGDRVRLQVEITWGCTRAEPPNVRRHTTVNLKEGL
jgi:hypothetical protein